MQMLSNKENNQTEILNQIIQDGLSKYELFGFYYVLEGIELVGIKNANLWFDLVSQIEKKGISNLPHYVLQMKKMPKKDLLEGLANLESNNLDSFENLIFGLNNYFDTKSKNL